MTSTADRCAKGGGNSVACAKINTKSPGRGEKFFFFFLFLFLPKRNLLVKVLSQEGDDWIIVTFNHVPTLKIGQT